MKIQDLQNDDLFRFEGVNGCNIYVKVDKDYYAMVKMLSLHTRMGIKPILFPVKMASYCTVEKL